jgi:hypothetical protein
MIHCPNHPNNDPMSKPIERWTVKKGQVLDRNITCETCWILYLMYKGLVREM